MTLIDRLRTGTHEQAVGLLLEVQESLKPQPSTSNHAPSARAWFVWKATFDTLLRVGTPEACVGAAMMLIPEGAWFLLRNHCGPQPLTRDMFEADVLFEGHKDRPVKWGPLSNTAALALAAAIMETRNG